MELNADEVLVAYLRILGVAALVIYGYAWVERASKRRITKGLLIGLLLGAGAVVSMHDPMELVPGVFYDGRSILLVLAPLYGGPIGTVVAAIMMTVYRLVIGGIGASGGVVGIWAVALAGFAINLIPKTRLGTGWRRSLLLGLATIPSLIVLAFLPFAIAAELARNAAIPVLLANFAGVLLLNNLFQREKQRVRMVRALENEASVDPLTQLPNRRYFQRAADKCAADAGLSRLPFSVIMLDIDHFKKINDTWGHSAGDTVLAKVADIIRSSIRRSDIAARYGGEEIVMLLPQTGSGQALKVAEKIRRQIEATGFNAGSAELHVTVSIGIASAKEQDQEQDFRAVLEDADAALYRAKFAGRNRCELSAAA